MLKNTYSGCQLEVGTDEAGRGALSGPVVSAAVILPKNFYHELLNDSKRISDSKRKILRPIIEKKAISFAVSFVDAHEVDQFNVLQASIVGMQRSILAMSVVPVCGALRSKGSGKGPRGVLALWMQVCCCTQQSEWSF